MIDELVAAAKSAGLSPNGLESVESYDTFELRAHFLPKAKSVEQNSRLKRPVVSTHATGLFVFGLKRALRSYLKIPIYALKAQPDGSQTYNVWEQANQ